MKQKTYKKRIVVLSVFLALFLLLFLLAAVMAVRSYTVESTARILPSYAKEDISALLRKEELSAEDYDKIYHQTGLSKRAVDDLPDREQLLLYQENFFYDGKTEHDMAAFTTPHDKLAGGKVLAFAPLRNGDVVVTSSCHTFGWRNGHAALVVNADSKISIESFDPTVKSAYGDLRWFESCTNFMVLRLKEEYCGSVTPAEIAKAAEEKLLGIKYDLTVGIFSPKDQCKNGRTPKKTHCAHVVWQAFQNFGMDIDGNGGAVVTARDIARSEYFEVVQVNGFDPDRLWYYL